MSRTYNAALATAVQGDKLLPHVPISAVEILTYAPLHLTWPSIMMRLYQAGFRGPEMAKAQLHARGMLSAAEYQRRKDALRHAILVAGRRFFNDRNFTQGGYANDPRLQPISAATYPNGDCLAHYDGSEITTPLASLDPNPPTLQQVANGVVNHPTGNDAGILTQAIQWAQATGQLASYTTDDVGTIAAQQGFVTPAAARGPHWDQGGLATIQAIANP